MKVYLAEFSYVGKTLYGQHNQSGHIGIFSTAKKAEKALVSAMRDVLSEHGCPVKVSDLVVFHGDATMKTVTEFTYSCKTMCGFHDIIGSVVAETVI